MDKSIKAVCKRCGKSSPVDSYVLDPYYRMMVCPTCVKERKDKERGAESMAQQNKEKAKQEEVMKSKPAGWDSEDELLERTQKQRKAVSANFEKISDDKVKYTCPKCKYKFIYNTVSKYPSTCPYCGTTIFTFNMK
jgi:hypothetical protein